MIPWNLIGIPLPKQREKAENDQTLRKGPRCVDARRHLLNSKRSKDPTTKELWKLLRDGYESEVTKGRSEQHALTCVLTTWAICRLNGNTLSWFRKIGFLTDFSAQTQMRIRECWLSSLRDESVGRDIDLGKLDSVRKYLSKARYGNQGVGPVRKLVDANCHKFGACCSSNTARDCRSGLRAGFHTILR